MDPLHYTIDIPSPRNQLWDALTTPHGLARWLCLRARVEPTVGGAFELFFNPDETRPDSDSTIGCRVLSIDRPRLLRITWRGSDEVAEVMNDPDAPVTEVEFVLIPALHGTRMEVTHSGWGDGPQWERARDWFDGAWRNALEQLLAACGQKESSEVES